MSARHRGISAASVLAAGAVVLALTTAPAGAKVAKARPAAPSSTIAMQARQSPATTPAAPSTTTAPRTDPFAPPPATAATVHVSIVDFGFSPASITVRAGTTVEWTNTGQSIHSVTSDTGAFDSNPSCPSGPCIEAGGTYSHTFTTAGTFAYHCRVHANMTAVVVVIPAPSTTTTTAAGPTTTAAPGASSGTAPPSSGVAAADGNQLAFTGPASTELWLALGAVFAIAIGFALRPRRRPFPIPVPVARRDAPNARHPRPPSPS